MYKVVLREQTDALETLLFIVDPEAQFDAFGSSGILKLCKKFIKLSRLQLPIASFPAKDLGLTHWKN